MQGGGGGLITAAPCYLEDSVWEVRCDRRCFLSQTQPSEDFDVEGEDEAVNPATRVLRRRDYKQPVDEYGWADTIISTVDEYGLVDGGYDSTSRKLVFVL